MSGVHPRYREIFVLVALGCAILVSLSHPVPLNLAARSAAQPDVSGLHQLQPHNTAAQHKALSLAPEESQTANQQPGAPCPPEACNTAQPPRQRTPQDPLPTRSGPGLLPKPGSAWAGALVLSAAAVCGACAYALGYWMRRRQIRGARHVECGPWATLAVGGLPHAPTVPRRGGHSGRTWLLPVKGRGALAPAPLARAVPGPTPPGLRLSGGTALYAAARRQQQTEDPVEAPSAPSDPQQMWKAFTETVASTVSETINQAGERIVSTAAETAAKAVLGLAEELQGRREAFGSLELMAQSADVLNFVGQTTDGAAQAFVVASSKAGCEEEETPSLPRAPLDTEKFSSAAAIQKMQAWNAVNATVAAQTGIPMHDIGAAGKKGRKLRGRKGKKALSPAPEGWGPAECRAWGDAATIVFWSALPVVMMLEGVMGRKKGVVPAAAHAPIHVVLPDALARDGPLYEAMLQTQLRQGPSRGMRELVEAKVGVSESAEEYALILDRMAIQCMRAGWRDAAGRVAGLVLGADHAPVATWSAASAPAASRGAVVLYYVMLDEDGFVPSLRDLALALAGAVDAARDRLSFSVVGVGFGLEEEARERAQVLLNAVLERVLVGDAQLEGLEHLEVVVDALWTDPEEVPEAAAAEAAAEAAEAEAAAEAAEAEAVTEQQRLEIAVTKELLEAADDIEAGRCEAAQGPEMRSAILSPLGSTAELPEDIAAALERFDAALYLSWAVLNAEAAEDVDAQRAALPDWTAATARARAAGVAEDAAVPRRLRAAVDAATSAVALADRLRSAAEAVPTESLGNVDAGDVAALEALVAEARAAACAAALARPLAAADAALAQWRAVLALREAQAQEPLDFLRLKAAMEAAEAAGVDIASVPAPAPRAPAAAVPEWQPREPGDWQSAGAAMQWDKGTVLGEGSVGTVVYAGALRPVGRGAAPPAAVKRLRRDPGERGQHQLSLVKREVDNVMRLQRKGAPVVQFHEIHYDDDWIYLGFERCRGALAAAASLDGRAPPRALQAAAKKIEAPGGRVRALREVATALGAVHAEGVSHNDLNANNVLIDRDGAFKLHDLQLAVVAPGAGGGGGAAGGSQFFSLTTFANAGLEINMARRAPEFLSGGRLTNKVDVWALGVLAYQLLTTQPSPFAGADAAGTPAAIAQENARIQDADFCLDALEAAPLSRRERHEAGHLIGRCLQAQPRTRPSVEEFLRHPLFWPPAYVVQAVCVLRSRNPQEAAAKAALQKAGLAGLYDGLAEWPSRVHPPLRNALEAFGRGAGAGKGGYGPGVAQLCRFVRNAYEHPPPWEALPGRGPAGRGGPDVDARKAAVVEHIVEALPGLGLCAYVLLRATARDEPRADDWF